MDLRKLRYFLTVVEAGGFRRAAEVLNIAQPTLTRQIQALEAELGAPLLVRGPTGVAPTGQGTAIVDEIREILARIDALPGLVAPAAARLCCDIRLGLPSALADVLFGTLIERVHAKHPGIHIICQEGAAGLIENVENGVLDLAVVSVTSLKAKYQCDLEYLTEEQDYLIALPDHCPKDSSMSITDMLEQPLILTPQPNARRQNLEQLARKNGVALKVVAEAATMSAQLNLVLRGLGAAVLPRSVARLMQRDGQVKAVAVTGLLSWRAMLSTRECRNPAAAKAVAHELRQIFLAYDQQTGSNADIMG
ncbi:LysR family transcriptional regulator [Thalassospira marina]|uniref:HTH lysR-type domain-containing protein n=1 Tax=Thalassospira marina TaxID=2048283 RepID=A0ABM6Q7L3_9PROT|nr:LysR family transcriptional regulator [Thalassospira marina]AUG52514.1 hypothetical protein CSC3H3_07135 [Thalassospira marina]